jgi:hypothetical protein
MFEKTEWTVTNEQSRNTGNIRHKSRNKTMSEKTDWIIKNRQSRDTEASRTRHRTKTYNKKQKTQKKKNMSNTDPTKGGDEPGCSRTISSTCLYS